MSRGGRAAIGIAVVGTTAAVLLAVVPAVVVFLLRSADSA